MRLGSKRYFYNNFKVSAQRAEAQTSTQKSEENKIYVPNRTANFETVREQDVEFVTFHYLNAVEKLYLIKNYILFHILRSYGTSSPVVWCTHVLGPEYVSCECDHFYSLFVFTVVI